MLTFIDFFAGIGGFRRGMELAGHKCIGFCEFDKFAAAGYTAMHLMTDEDRERIAALVNSDSQLYRLAVCRAGWGLALDGTEQAEG